MAPALRLVLDTTIASPWAFKVPPLDNGVDIVVASGTKSLGGNDRDMWGYIATNDTQFANSVMDLIAMRGGILDWRRAAAVTAAFDGASDSHARRSATAAKVAAFLTRIPRSARCSIRRCRIIRTARRSTGTTRVTARCCRSGSTAPTRIARGTIADVLATTVIVRYALSFDGLATKVNHHRTVSEYFTAPDQLKRNGFDRLIRLAVGLEDADDLIAALNWTLHHGDAVTAADIERVAARTRAGAGDLTWAQPHISASSPASTTGPSRR